MTRPASAAWQPLGFSCSYRFEPPDVFFGRAVGRMPTSDMEATIREVRSAAGAGRIFWLVDHTQNTDVEAGARTLLAAAMPTLPIHALVSFGLKTHIRTAGNLFIRAMKLLHPTSAPAPLVLLETEAQARAWIASRRAELAR